MNKTLVTCSSSNRLRGDFCITQISHSNPDTEVKVMMDDYDYTCNTSNIANFRDKDRDVETFFTSGVFCKEITVDAPDAHVMIRYKDLGT